MALIRDNSRCINSKLIHISYTLPEGLEGDALILDESQPSASALEQSSRSSVSAIGLRGPGVVNFERAGISTTSLDISPKESIFYL
jgi:hypothetical protein